MKKTVWFFLIMGMSVSIAQAADKISEQEAHSGKTEVKSTWAAKPVKETMKESFVAKDAAVTAPAQPVDSEASKKLTAIKAQEEWVARLKKQLDGETNQLKEMRKSLAESFHLDPLKLEKGDYKYDEKSGKFVED